MHCLRVRGVFSLCFEVHRTFKESTEQLGIEMPQLAVSRETVEVTAGCAVDVTDRATGVLQFEDALVIENPADVEDSRRLGQFRVAQLRAGQVRVGQVRAGQVRVEQGRAGQGRAGQVRAAQVRVGQGRGGQVRAGQVRVDQFRVGQFRVGQFRVGQVRAG